MIGSIVYQIFPERFCNGNKENDPVNVKEWGSEVDRDCFMGGDLEGITSKLDYIKDLGADVIYLNPIFKSKTNHKYDIDDYLTIDPSFGTLEDFKKLLAACHSKGMKVIIDGVFNHTSTEFAPFKDILENQEKSKYKDWYSIFSYPVNTEQPPCYKTFGGVCAMPKLNGLNPEVQDYITKVIKYWEGVGVDGFRLDVPYEIHDEMLKKIRECTKLYIVAEMWGCGKRFIPKYFDGVTNYDLRDLIRRAVVNQAITGAMFADEWKIIEATYGKNIHYVFNLGGSHDTERLYNHCGGNIKKEKLFYAFLFLLPGIPMIYYGDEIGMEGANDPYCRGTMIWDKSKWNMELYEEVKKLAELRNKFTAIQKGSIEFTGFNENMLAFERRYEGETVKVYINFGHYNGVIDGVELKPLEYKVIL